MVQVQLSWIFGPQLTWSPHSITIVIISKSVSSVFSATIICCHIGMVVLMYLEPSSQLTTRTPNASLWSFAKIAFAKLVRSDYSTSLHHKYCTLASSSAQTAGLESNPWMRTAMWERSPRPSLTPRVSSWNTGLRISCQCGIQVVEKGNILLSVSINLSKWMPTMAEVSTRTIFHLRSCSATLPPPRSQSTK